MTTLSRLLKRHGACAEAVKWAKPYKTLREAWKACTRGDWMLRLAGLAELCSRQGLVLAACACARLALPYVKKGEKRPLAAIETAERWARGEATLEEVRSSASAFSSASSASSAAAASSAAYAASSAFSSASSASSSAAAAAAAASSAFAAAYAAYDDASAARTKVLAQCADIVRAQAIKGKWRIK